MSTASLEHALAGLEQRLVAQLASNHQTIASALNGTGGSLVLMPDDHEPCADCGRTFEPRRMVIHARACRRLRQPPSKAMLSNEQHAADVRRAAREALAMIRAAPDAQLSQHPRTIVGRTSSPVVRPTRGSTPPPVAVPSTRRSQQQHQPQKQEYDDQEEEEEEEEEVEEAGTAESDGHRSALFEKGGRYNTGGQLEASHRAPASVPVPPGPKSTGAARREQAQREMNRWQAPQDECQSADEDEDDYRFPEQRQQQGQRVQQQQRRQAQKPPQRPPHRQQQEQQHASPPPLPAEEEETEDYSAAPPVAEYPTGSMDEEEAGPAPDLAQCSVCSRSFAADRLERHMKICAKQSSKKRKVFGESAERLKAREKAEKEEAKIADELQKKKAAAVTAKLQFQAAMKTASALANGEAPPEPVPVADDRTPCPHCGRKFATDTAERHIPKCAQTKAKPNAVGSQQKRPSGASGKPPMPSPVKKPREPPNPVSEQAPPPPEPKLNPRQILEAKKAAEKAAEAPTWAPSTTKTAGKKKGSGGATPPRGRPIAPKSRAVAAA